MNRKVQFFSLQISYSFTMPSAVNRIARQFKFTIARRSSVSRYKWFSKLRTIVKIYSISWEFSMLLQTLRRRSRVRRRVPESVRCRFTRNDILIIFFFCRRFPSRLATGDYYLAGRDAIFRRSFSRLFFFHIPIRKRIAFRVYRASTVRRRLRGSNAPTLPSDLPCRNF